MSCCYDTHIALNPYEITRLARGLQLSTTQFIADYLTDGGIVLRSREKRACIMLDDASCKVYSDRPLICRAYPLLRTLGPEGEQYVRYKPLPTTKGVYGEDGTVDEFLQVHDVDAFVAANDRYFELLQRIIAALARVVGSAPELFPIVRQTIDNHCEFHTPDTPKLIDVDNVVADFCREREIAVPADMDDLIRMYMLAIEDKLARLHADGPASSETTPSLDTIETGANNQLVLELSALAGALGAATGARVALLLTAAVLGKPAEISAEGIRGSRFRERD